MTKHSKQWALCLSSNRTSMQCGILGTSMQCDIFGTSMQCDILGTSM